MHLIEKLDRKLHNGKQAHVQCLQNQMCWFGLKHIKLKRTPIIIT